MIKLRYIGGLAAVLLLLALGSCYKVQPTTATITVTDVNGTPLPGTMVRLFPNPTEPANPPAELNQELDQTKQADAQGKVYFDYSSYYQRGQVGLYVLNIEATSGDTITVPGIIKVEEQKDNFETVKFPFDI